MPINFTPSDYRAYINMSKNRHLLVEGRDDKRVFKFFLDEISSQTNSSDLRYRIDIDSAEDLIAFGNSIGNRDKVERIIESVSTASYTDKLVGFVDRDFREFNIGSTLTDTVNGHKSVGQLIWSKGHSIENYYFDFDILRYPLRDFSVTPYFDKSLDLLENIFEKAIRLACAYSLTGYELEIIGIIRTAINWKIIDISSSDVALNTDNWQRFLGQRSIASSNITEILNRFEAWNNIVKTADFSVVRWLCHGHIGLAYIWAVYGRCIYEITQQENEVNRVLQASESVRFNACASNWVKRALNNYGVYPREVFILLHLPVPEETA
jgi:hypothetical protein